MTSQIINSNIVRVTSDFNSDIGYSNSYIIFDDEITIIDIGIRNQGKEILSIIEDYGKKPKDVKNILLTHAHPYVVGDLGWLKKKTQAKILASQFSSDILSNYDESLTKMFGLSKKDSLLFIKRKIPVDFKTIEVDDILKNRGVIKLGEKKLVAIETNGHCSGHLCFWDLNSKILFTGDELINYPNSYTKFIIDRTGSFNNREFALELFLELSPMIVCQVHDIPLMDNMISNNINNVLQAQKLWVNIATEFIQTEGKVKLIDLEYYIKKSLGIKWTDTMEKMENNSTTLMLLKLLEEDSIIEKVETKQNNKKNKDKKIEETQWMISKTT